MRYDHEFVVAQAVADYLKDNLGISFLASCPVVTFMDPMSIDDASRVVVMVPAAESMIEDPQNSVLTVEVNIKTQWKQPTIGADFQKHYDRVSWVRDKFATNSRAICADLNAWCVAGVWIDFIGPKRAFKSDVMAGWLFTEFQLQINCHACAEADGEQAYPLPRDSSKVRMQNSSPDPNPVEKPQVELTNPEPNLDGDGNPILT